MNRIGIRVRVSFAGSGVIIGVEYPWGEEDDPLYEVELDFDGRIAYATPSQIDIPDND